MFCFKNSYRKLLVSEYEIFFMICERHSWVSGGVDLREWRACVSRGTEKQEQIFFIFIL